MDTVAWPWASYTPHSDRKGVLPSPLTIREISHYPICDGGGWKKPDCSLVSLYLYCTVYSVHNTPSPLFLSVFVNYKVPLRADTGNCVAVWKKFWLLNKTSHPLLLEFPPNSAILCPIYQLTDKLFFVRPLYISTGEFEKLSDYRKSDQWLNLSRLSGVGLTKKYRYDWRGFVKVMKDEHRPLSI